MWIGFYERRSLTEAASLWGGSLAIRQLDGYVSVPARRWFSSLLAKGRKQQQPTEVFRLFE